MFDFGILFSYLFIGFVLVVIVLIVRILWKLGNRL